MATADNEKLGKYLMFSTWMSGTTPTINTKGQLFIEGTFLKNIPEFSLYLYANYLELEGYYHTSVTVNYWD